MSRSETLSPATERFYETHRRAIDLLAHMIPLDVTLQIGMSPSVGRATITATEHPPILTETVYSFRKTPAGLAVDREISILSLDQAGELAVTEQNETQASVQDGVLPQRWHGPAEPEILSDYDRGVTLLEVGGAVDELYNLAEPEAD